MMNLTQCRLAVSTETLPARFHAQIPTDDELALVLNVGAREDTATIVVENKEQTELLAYAVIGPDVDGMITIYAARSFLTGIGAMALRGLFGAAEVVSAPLRVHTETLRGYARMLGAGDALSAIDGDGVPMGIFTHGQ